MSPQPHPLADLLPAMTPDEYRALVADIRIRGLAQPILLYEGKILDGRHREAACAELGVVPRYVVYEGDDPLGVVLSANVHRRHLTPSQRAMLAADAETIYAGEARLRQAHGETAPGRTLSADRREVSNGGRAIEEAARNVGASPRTAQKAKRIKETDPELAQRVRRGDITVNKAEERIATAEGEAFQDRALGVEYRRAVALGKALRSVVDHADGIEGVEVAWRDAPPDLRRVLFGLDRNTAARAMEVAADFIAAIDAVRQIRSAT